MNDSISVGAFVAILNETLGFAYPEVTIQGEVSGYKVNQNKWVFFDVKDDEAALPCFMPLYNLKVPVEDGMTVRISGSPKLRNNGKFSFTVRRLELAGEGELKRAFELLKAKLGAEGLFDESRKRGLPNFPRRLGLVTSINSAAYHDFMKIMQQRWGGLTVVVADVLVQGAAAPDAVVAALGHLNQLPNPLDVIVVARGGGSLEDLAAFSNEAVVRAVAASRTPVVVGVGHEVDISLADLAADLRAATPTDAARLVVPDRREVAARVTHLRSGLISALETDGATLRHQLDQLGLRLERFIDTPAQQLTLLNQRLRRGLLGLEHAMVTQAAQTSHYQRQIVQQQHDQWRRQTQVVSALTRLLAGFDPTATLRRGYAIVRSGGQVIKRAAAVKAGQSLVIQLAEGELEATTGGTG